MGLDLSLCCRHSCWCGDCRETAYNLECLEPMELFHEKPQTHAVCTRKRLQQPRADQCLLSHAGCKGWLAGVASDEPENGQTREAKCR